MEQGYDVGIIGAGILGISIANFLSSSTNAKVLLIEQGQNVALHTSSRNTGKVHAPFLYDPVKKKCFAKAAFLGFSMWKDYCASRSIPFKQDGVLEIATHDKGIDRLRKYLDWGYSNGLQQEELRFLDGGEVSKLEPNVRCKAAILCTRDGSVNYGKICMKLVEEAATYGCHIALGSQVKKIENRNEGVYIHTTTGKFLAKYVVNAAGGNAVDIAHSVGVATEYTDLHFRGEYWVAPEKYHDLTKVSVYSVPNYPEYPFLDPHWIVRVDGRREIGPNAVPVFGPYAYSWKYNASVFLPKLLESVDTGAGKIFLDRQFLSLAMNELKSSLFKTAMIERVREFLPQIRPSDFSQRGTSGVRASLVDKEGKFVPDTLLMQNDYSLHILNYNSPGATGALPMSAMIVNMLVEKGIARYTANKKVLWDIQNVAEQMKTDRV